MRETEKTPLTEKSAPLSALSAAKKAVGLKQVRRAVTEGRALRTYLARDADPSVVDPISALCRERDIPVVTDFTMRQLGKACGIAVGAAAAAAVKG